MQYNVCETCGARDGRAGNLFQKAGDNNPMECRCCWDSRKSGRLVLHSDLERTSEEISRIGVMVSSLDREVLNQEHRKTVMQLRKETGAGVLSCRRALKKSLWNLAKAKALVLSLNFNSFFLI
jgi:hypothetical protein